MGKISRSGGTKTAATRFSRGRNLKALFPLLILVTSLLDTQSKHEIHQLPIVFTHVAVIDMAGASIQKDMMVVIAGDRIVYLAKGSEGKVPRSARVIDGHGKFLMPGLWDMHVHLFQPNQPPPT